MEAMNAESEKEDSSNRRTAKNGPQNGPKIGHFQRNSSQGYDGPSVSVGVSELVYYCRLQCLSRYLVSTLI